MYHVKEYLMDKKVLVEIEETEFMSFVCWLRSVKIADVDVHHIRSVHKVLGCFEESMKEIQGELL